MPEFVELEQMKDFLGITGGNPRHDAVIQGLIADGSALFEKETGRVIDQTAHTEYLHIGQRQDVVNLKQYPIISCDGISYADELDLAYESDEYFVEEDTGQIHMLDGAFFAPGKRKLVVTYEAGFANTPNDVQLATMIQVAGIFTNRRQRGFVQQSMGASSHTSQNRYEVEFNNAIMRYERRGF